ncbi:hypothetical protein ACF3DV_06590 [Chlorogloeopsis fritschii PCC 9212]|uniref:Uncharacterized protein n=1 Tax=Chlorogloeopsis fritschii PCC 6912 TaxID=211165 RepID=A0A433N5V5_CHLFR|nr:hypothetical protein [Chlorogloeopsis fritschii]RUR76778.1 hypothetical protein PCC6912_41820 [Chlorogloeopsis fritschii PCC 6912]
MYNLEDRTNSKIFSVHLGFIALCFFIGLAGFAYVLAILPGIAESTTVQPRTCITGGWKFGLIITHVLTFGLIPLAMRIFYQSLNNLGFPIRTIFASQLGLAFIMVAIASEIGWHVTQCWYYQNDFTMLNFMFYFFLISAFALWSDGLIEKTTAITNLINIIFAISLLVVSILYPLGYQENNDNFKVPIYIALTLVFSVLTYRGYKVLQNWKIMLVPFFSVGVNLSFVFLLDKFGGNPYTNPQILFNALFHILHDLLGTEAGVAIFTWLIYMKGITPQNIKEN